MQIPWQQLAPETVTAILEEFATREGTDYGHEQYTLAQKVAMLRRQLERGDVAISFDSQTETCSLITLR
jgi:uncharacterized protein YheU (UPF0270 family)